MEGKKMNKIKIGYQKVSKRGIRWTVICLRPFRIRVETADEKGIYGNPYISFDCTKKEFLEFGELVKK